MPAKQRPKGSTSAPPEPAESDEAEAVAAARPQDEFQAPPDFAVPEGYERPPPHEDHEKMPQAMVDSVSGMLIRGVRVVHKKAAQATGYAPWALDEDEEDLWDYVIHELVPHLPLKWAYVVIAILLLAILEGNKIAGYLAWSARMKKSGKAGGD